MSNSRQIRHGLHLLLALLCGGLVQRASADTQAEVLFLDSSTVKLCVELERIDFATPYGKLSIPLTEVQRIEFAARVPDDLAPKIDAAITDLGSDSYPTREAASAELVKHSYYALPALHRAVKSKDAETAMRAEEVIGKLRDELPDDLFEVPTYDTLQTEHGKFIGHIEGAGSWRVRTTQFGEVAMRLADLKSLKFPRGIDPATAVNDPGHVMHLSQQLGKVFTFRVTAAKAGQVWGSGPYTADSALCVAAVHAGLLRVGQTGIVQIRMMGQQQAFIGGTRNGVTSLDYGACPSFQFVK